jgi:hypothetical protein
MAQSLLLSPRHSSPEKNEIPHFFLKLIFRTLFEHIFEHSCAAVFEHLCLPMVVPIFVSFFV